MPLRWYTARTQPRSEFAAAAELERDGFEVYLPKIKAIHPRAGHLETSLFPGYLFLRCDRESQDWPTFHQAHHVAGWVNFGGEVPWLPDETVDALKERSDSINQDGGLWHRFEAGEKVQVVSGNLEGIAEVLESAKSPDASVQVLLQFMGRTVRAKIPWKDLRAVAGQSPANRQTTNARPPRRTRGKGRWTHQFRDSTIEAVGAA